MSKLQSSVHPITHKVTRGPTAQTTHLSSARGPQPSAPRWPDCRLAAALSISDGWKRPLIAAAAAAAAAAGGRCVWALSSRPRGPPPLLLSAPLKTAVSLVSAGAAAEPGTIDCGRGGDRRGTRAVLARRHVALGGVLREAVIRQRSVADSAVAVAQVARDHAASLHTAGLFCNSINCSSHFGGWAGVLTTQSLDGSKAASCVAQSCDGKKQ